MVRIVKVPHPFDDMRGVQYTGDNREEIINLAKEFNLTEHTERIFGNEQSIQFVTVDKKGYPHINVGDYFCVLSTGREYILSKQYIHNMYPTYLVVSDNN